jgi:hypothetical protein
VGQGSGLWVETSTDRGGGLRPSTAAQGTTGVWFGAPGSAFPRPPGSDGAPHLGKAHDALRPQHGVGLRVERDEPVLVLRHQPALRWGRRRTQAVPGNFRPGVGFSAWPDMGWNSVRSVAALTSGQTEKTYIFCFSRDEPNPVLIHPCGGGGDVGLIRVRW